MFIRDNSVSPIYWLTLDGQQTSEKTGLICEDMKKQNMLGKSIIGLTLGRVEKSILVMFYYEDVSAINQ